MCKKHIEPFSAMKILFLILITLNQSVYANTDVPTYILTPSCLTSISASDTKSNTGWTVIININNIEAEKLLTFSKKHLRKRVRFIDGNGNKIGGRDVMLQSHISKSIHLTGLKSHAEAQIIKNSILSTSGLCGVKY